MNDTKFTKGEWKIQDDGYGMIGVLLKKGVGILIGRKSKEAQANAHLIAAAPEMYSLINDLRHAVSMAGIGGGVNNTEVLKSIDELLAKARGEQ